jgi:shikimate kinase
VADIFKNKGEAEFRFKESALIEELCCAGASNLVLSTGGGLPIFGANLQKLESLAIVVYLTAPLEVLVTRINRGEERPLLAGAGTGPNSAPTKDVQERLGKLIAERESIYNRARYRIDTSTSTVEELVGEVIRLTGLVLPSGS